MARILYGVQGDGRGHAVRSLAVARHYPQHEFLFVSHSQGAEFLRRSYRVLEFISPVTLVHRHRLASLSTFYQNLRFWVRRNGMRESLLEEVRRFNPDYGITDWEFFVPHLCRQVGIPCVSLDHQHIVTSAIPNIPLSQWPAYVGLHFSATRIFNAAPEYLVVSFFLSGLMRNGGKYRVLPPILREPVLDLRPVDRGHVLSYQSTSTFKGYLPLLRCLSRPVVVYGQDAEGTDGNLRFKRLSEEGFLEDLEGCSYVICGGSHNVISEALHLGKPVFAFPIAGLFEQYLNVHYLRQLGYGSFSMDHRANPCLLSVFEKRLDGFRANLQKGSFCGNREVFEAVDRFLTRGTIVDHSRAGFSGIRR
jgi:uncharacterized protein (TIGR00661 family)